MLTIRPASHALGIEIVDIDAKNLSDRDFGAIYDAWLNRVVAVFRNQRLTPLEQVEFARRFGQVVSYMRPQYAHPLHPEILVLSNVIENRRPIGAAISGRYWHTDGHFSREPPAASVLYALQVPAVGGDTWFANMYSAYESLPPQTKQRLEGLKVIISRLQSRPYNYPDRPPPTEAEKASWEDMPQPLVRTHPITGRKALYVGGNVPWRIEGMQEEESVPLIKELQAFAIRPEFTYAHQWRQGDLIVWDNRSAMHKATPYDMQRYSRLMHRITIAGDVPF